MRNLHYLCSLCKMPFECKEKFINHLYKAHMNPLYNCDRCERRFANQEELLLHSRLEHGTRICKRCNLSYSPENPSSHVCGQLTDTFVCTLGNCRDKHYYRLNFYIRHLKQEHKISNYGDLKACIEQNCIRVVKPFKTEPKKVRNLKKKKRRGGIGGRSLSGSVNFAESRSMVSDLSHLKVGFEGFEKLSQSMRNESFDRSVVDESMSLIDKSSNAGIKNFG